MKKGILAAEIAVILGLIACGVFLGGKVKACMDLSAKGNKFEHSRVVLYQGPATLADATEADLEVVNESQRDMTLKHSTDTKVTVNGNDCYVYETNVNNTRTWSTSYLPNQSRTPVTYFAFEGLAEITVTVPNIDIESVTVSPLSYGIVPEVDAQNHTVTFTIDTVDDYTVVFNNTPARALHIFTFPIEEDAPSPDDENVLYFGPGEWDLGDYSITDEGTIVYLAGGAVVHGTFNVNFVDNITIMGRGIIDGSTYDGWKGKNAKVPLNYAYSDGSTIQDVIVLNPNAWAVQQNNCTNGVIDGVHIISSRPNGDGISLQSCADYTIQNCFVRSWDDSIVVKNYGRLSSENINVSDCQFWTDLAQSMEIGFETNKGRYDDMTIKNVTFEDITVLHNYHKPIISIHNGDDALVSDITFRNITVEDNNVGAGDCNLPYIIDLYAGMSTWSSTPDRGTIQNVTIENVNFLSGTVTDIRIAGDSDELPITDVTLKNINLYGDVLTETDGSNLHLSNVEGLSVQADDDFIASVAAASAQPEDTAVEG